MAKYNIKTNDPLDELHDIVNEKDEIIGVAKRIDFLKDKNLIRRSCHILLKNSKGKFWFQQRSEKKDLQPLHWSCAAAGFVNAGKNSQKEILQEARRELKEELGIESNIKFIKTYLHRNKKVGGIMVYIFLGFHDGPFKFDPKEVVQMKDFDISYLYKIYKEGRIKLTDPTIPELEYFLENKI